MSLVQEALKRKAEEQQTTGPAESAGPAPESSSSGIGAPSLPPAIPPDKSPAARPPEKEPPPPNGRQNTMKTLLVWMLVLLVLIGLAVAAYLAFSSGILSKPAIPEKTTKAAAEQEPTAIPAAAAAETTEEPERKHSTAYKLISKTKEITTAERRDREEAAELMEQPSVTPIETAAPPTPEATVKKPTPVPPPTRLPATGKSAQSAHSAKENTEAKPGTAIPAADTATTAQDAPTVWPKIKLTGVMASKNKSAGGLAFIDGQVTACGQRVQGIKLISVHSDGVVLEYQGEIRTLRVGGEMF